MSEPHECCICHAPVVPPYHMLGRRVYCAHHFEVVNKPHPGFWRAGVVQILGMALFCGLVIALAGPLGPLSGTPRILAGLFLAIVPTALWLWYFYRQDRLEPEPKTRIVQVLLLALLLTDVLGLRIITGVFALDDWATQDTLTSLLASVLVEGVVFQAIIYASIRLAVYDSPEFDERMDGIVYGTAAGLGVATLLNLHYIIDNEGVALAPGVIQTVTTALAQASFGGVLGYFMAEARFTHRPIWWVPAGLSLAAVLNGLFSWLISEVSAAGLQVESWRSLVLGLAVALGTLGLLVVLMRRVTRVTLASPRA